jgi:DNA-binding HxlR family transcriptional regulator
MNCSVAQCLEVVGDWWTMLIVRDVFFGVRRFDDIQRRLGISRNTLTQRLDHLVENEILARRPYQENPVRHEYVLTDRGRDLWLVLNALRQWGDRWFAPDGPPVELVHDGCGERTEIVPSCAGCGEALGPRDVRAVAGPGASEGSPLPVA